MYINNIRNKAWLVCFVLLLTGTLYEGCKKVKRNAAAGFLQEQIQGTWEQVRQDTDGPQTWIYYFNGKAVTEHFANACERRYRSGRFEIVSDKLTMDFSEEGLLYEDISGKDIWTGRIRRIDNTFLELEYEGAVIRLTKKSRYEKPPPIIQDPEQIALIQGSWKAEAWIRDPRMPYDALACPVKVYWKWYFEGNRFVQTVTESGKLSYREGTFEIICRKLILAVSEEEEVRFVMDIDRLSAAELVVSEYNRTPIVFTRF